MITQQTGVDAVPVNMSSFISIMIDTLSYQAVRVIRMYIYM